MQLLVYPDELLALKVVLWPQVTFYPKQIEIIESTLWNDETYVPAGNMLGKDFVAGFIALGCFIVCEAKDIRCRIVTTSVAEHHLKVLWAEIASFISMSRMPLLKTPKEDGPFVLNYQELRRKSEAHLKNPINYLIGRVSERGEGLAGHHSQFTLAIGDEVSGLDDKGYGFLQGWARRKLFIGNPNPCENFFRRAVRAGDIIEPDDPIEVERS